MAKADNLLALLWLLRSRGQLTAARIAEELGITVRTVYRYVDALCASGAPIASEGGPGGGFLLLDTFREPPLFFDAEERTALLHASMFADQAGYPFSDALRRALGKIRYRMDQEQLGELDRHAAAVGVLPERLTTAAGACTSVDSEGRAAAARGLGEIGEPGAEAPARALAVIERAAATMRALAIDYASLEGKKALRRTIEPYGLVYWREMWYVVGYCRLRKGIRIFRSDRISAIADTGETFERPAGFSISDWFARQMIPDSSKRDSIEVRIEGAPGSIDHLARHWILRGLIRRRSQSEIQLRMGREAAIEHLPHLLLGYGTSIRVAAPSELQARLAGLAAEAAAFHATFLEPGPGARSARGGRRRTANH